MTPKTQRHLKIEYVDPHSLKPWKGNPRIMSNEEHEKLKAGIREFGVVDPLIARRRDNLVIGGHQRLEDVMELGLARVPVVYIDVSDRRMKALNLALNKIHGDWDEEKLASLLADMKDFPELELTGFDQAEIDRVIADAETVDLRETTGKANSQGLSIVPYLGGKQAIAPYLINMFPEHTGNITAYVEVFGGGASLLLNKSPSPIEVLNDLDGELVNLFEVIRDDIDRFLERSDFLVYSRELYEKWSREINSGQVVQDRVERAVRYWYCLRSSFAAVVGKGWAFSRVVDRTHADQIANGRTALREIHERIKRVEIDHLDFERLIDNRDAPSTLFFLDPPYLNAEEYRIGTFSLDDHKRLADRLSRVQGKWLMTIGDTPEIRALYPGQIKGALNTTNSTSKVIGEERTRLVRNLIVSNYPLPRQVLQVVT